MAQALPNPELWALCLKLAPPGLARGRGNPPTPADETTWLSPPWQGCMYHPAGASGEPAQVGESILHSISHWITLYCLIPDSINS
jgi:hypothetical protein